MMTKTEFTAFKLAAQDRALCDQRLTHLAYRVLCAFHSAADWRTGTSRCRQTDIAQMFGVARRSVRRCLDCLVEFKYLEPVGVKPGKYISAYKVLSPKSGLCGPVLAAAVAGNEKGDPTVRKGDPTVRNEDRPVPHKNPYPPLILPSANRETEPGGPRQRAFALGPLGEQLERRIGPPRFHDWFVRGGAELVSQTADTVTIAVKSSFFAEQIRNRFDSDIAAASGASRVVIEVREAAASKAAG